MHAFVAYTWVLRRMNQLLPLVSITQNRVAFPEHRPIISLTVQGLRKIRHSHTDKREMRKDPYYGVLGINLQKKGDSGTRNTESRARINEAMLARARNKRNRKFEVPQFNQPNH